MRAGVLFALFLVSPIFVCCSTEQNEKDFEWHIKDGNAVITKYKGESPDVVIPRKIQGRPVTEIGEGAFRGCGLTSVVIPQGVSIIRESAFSDNKLSSVNIPEKVTWIGASAFAENPLREIFIKSETLFPTAQDAFHSGLPSYLPSGKYILGDDESWFAENPDGTLITVHSLYEKLGDDTPYVLAVMMFDAVNRKDAELLRDCIS